MEREFLEASMALREREAAERQRAAEEREAQRQRELEAQRRHAEEQSRAASRFRRLAVVLAVAVIAAIAAAIFAWDRMQVAEKQRQDAEAQHRLADAGRKEAETQRKIADRRSQEARVRQLAAQSTAYLQQPRPPQLSLLLAVESVMARQTEDGILPIPAAEESLRAALALPHGKPLRVGHKAWVDVVTFGPDGRWLATSGWDGVRLWNMHERTAEPVVLRGHEKTVTAVAFSPDGRWLATGSWDPTVRLWDIHKRAVEPEVLRGHEKRVTAVAFSPDGRWLATGSEDHTVRLWRIQVHELIQLACQIVNRNLTQDEWQRLLGNTPYHKTCVDLPVHPSVYEAWLREITDLTKQGNITSALETLAKVQSLEPAAEIPDYTWYELCWFGSLWKLATEVMHACDKAVELSPEDGIAHQGRGLARALTGNFAGAVEDFEMYLEWAPENEQSGEDISLRLQWTEALKEHQNPFDAETLKKLRSQ